MKVPEYETQVQVQTPRRSTETAGSPATPGVVKDAFGGNVGKSVENLGKVGEKIADRLLELEIDKQDKHVLDLETNLMQDGFDRLNNKELIVVGEGEKAREIPKGLLNRQYEDADGITYEFMQQRESLEKKYLNGLSQYQFSKFKPAFDRHFEQTRQKIVAHEQQQWDASIKKSVESNVAQITLNAATLRTEPDLTQAIRDAQSAARVYNQRFDEKTQGLKNEELASEIIEGAVSSTLINDGSVAAQGLLDSMKDKVAAGTFEKLQGKLNSGKKAIDEIINRDRREKTLANRFDTISKIADGTINWSNIDSVMKNVAGTDFKLAEALKRVAQTKPTIEKEDDQAFLGLAEDIFKSETPEKIGEFLVDSLKNDPDISRDRLASLVYVAKKRAESLQKGDKTDFWNVVGKSMLNSIGTFSKPAEVFFNVIKKIRTDGESEEVVNSTIKKEAEKETVDFKSTPTRIHATKGKQRIYSDDNITWYDEKTGEEIK